MEDTDLFTAPVRPVMDVYRGVSSRRMAIMILSRRYVILEKRENISKPAVFKLKS